MDSLRGEPDRETMRSGCDSLAIRTSTQDPQNDQSEKVIANVIHLHVKNIDYTRSDDSRPVRPRFVANTEGGHLLVSRLAAVQAAEGETALEEPPELLIDFVREIQQKDASVHVDREGASAAGYERNSQGLLRFYGRVVVPVSAALRQEILKRNHDDQVASGHYGVSRTAELISRKYH
jgi:hypothetical protein